VITFAQAELRQILSQNSLLWQQGLNEVKAGVDLDVGGRVVKTSYVAITSRCYVNRDKLSTSWHSHGCTVSHLGD